MQVKIMTNMTLATNANSTMATPLRELILRRRERVALSRTVHETIRSVDDVATGGN